MFATIWNTILFYPLLNLTMALYHLLGDNLGLAIIFIAVIIRLLLIPLVKRQTEMTRKMSTLKPELDKLQKQYANNPQKLSEEQMKLYKKVGYNPLGCIGTFVPQLIILSVLIGVIRSVTAGTLEGLYPFIKDYIGYSEGFQVNNIFLFWDLTKTYNSVSTEFGKLSLQALPYIGLAVLVGLTQYITTVFTQKIQNPNPVSKKKKNNKEDISVEDMQVQMQNSMMFMFPLMTAFLTISTPAALGVYWVVQSLMLVVQYFILDFDKSKKGVQNLLDVFQKKNTK